MSYPLVCLGNPLLDLQVNVDSKYLSKYDLKENDAILAEEKHLPIYEEIVKFEGVKSLAGGAAQNAARGAQYALPPNSVAYFGSVGKDQYSDLLLKANEFEGVKSLYMYQEDYPTGKCAALINGVHRSLVTDLAAANHYKLEHLKKPENWEYVKNAKVFYVGGFHLTVCPPAIQALAEFAAETNKIFSMNLSAPFLPQFFKGPLDDSAPYWDYLIGNEAEAEAYAESHGLKENFSVLETAKAIAKLPKVNHKRPRVVVFTQGIDNTIAVTYNHTTDELTVQEFPVVQLDPSALVDTNGAGDAFAGGFLSGLVQGLSLEKSVAVGQWLAAQSIQENGPAYPYPKKTFTN